MENTKTRVRINLATREVEWEGSEAFVEKQQAIIQEFIEKIKSDPITNSSNFQKLANQNVQKSAPDEEIIKVPTSHYEFEIPSSFGEFYMNFQRNVKVVDKILIAAFFVQNKSSDGTFSPREAADLLDEQNVNVTNAGPFIKLLQRTGKIYKVGGKFKVHENGIEHLKQILSNQ